MNLAVPSQSVHLQTGKRVYFSSDFHLGAPNPAVSREREKKIVNWLESIRHDAQAIFLVGDIFDFWFEYKHAVPKGFVRLLGKLAELSDEGIKLVIFTGNHDMWMSDYLTVELHAEVYRDPVRYEFTTPTGTTRSILVGHGDGLGPGDHVYKQLKKVFENPLARWSFRQIHPDLGIRLATGWSRRSRISNNKKAEDEFLGEEREWLFQYCVAMEKIQHHDYYIFGHRHLPLNLRVNAKSRYINLGEWVTQQHYAVFDGSTVELLSYQP